MRRLHLLTLVLRMRMFKVFFALFPRLKKVRRLLRTRGRNCSPSRAHPRGRLSWRTPSSGCDSGMSTLASLTTGTDALERLPGSHRLTSRWCGSAKGMRRDWSARLTSLLFLLGEELYRQRRAVCKYWAGGLPSYDHAATCSSSSSSFTAGMDQKDRCSGLFKAGIGGYDAPRAVFPSLVCRPRMLCILAGTDLKYSCSGMYKAVFFWCSAPRAVLPEVDRKIGLFGRWHVTAEVSAVAVHCVTG